jgi:hypothetical protein
MYVPSSQRHAISDEELISMVVDLAGQAVHVLLGFAK